MAVLSEAEKRAVPESQQGLPEKSGTGSYPMPDKEHASLAKGFAKRFASSGQRKRIDAKANAILHKKAQQYGAK
jgi:hypothetical protein